MEFVEGMDIQQDAKLSGLRIMRGGCYRNSEPELLLASYRAAVNPQTATFSIPAIGRGFRIVLELP